MADKRPRSDSESDKSSNEEGNKRQKTKDIDSLKEKRSRNTVFYPNDSIYPRNNSKIQESTKDVISEQKPLCDKAKEEKFIKITDRQLKRDIEIDLNQNVLMQEITKGFNKQVAHERSIWHYLAKNGTTFMSDEIKSKAQLIRDNCQNDNFSSAAENWGELKLLLTLNEKGATRTTKETYILTMDMLNRANTN